MRKPQPGAFAPAGAAPVATGYVAPAPGAVAAAAPAAVVDPIAAADNEVRGVLDALKDSLFRLELRRQAGTIDEDEYARERARVEKVLRDLVKG